jgi:hypothetical protein
MRTEGIYDLRKTISDFRKAFAKIRRRKCFRNVRTGCGAIEPKLANNRRMWAVHSHLIMDTDNIDFGELNEVWRVYTRRRGKFEAAPEPIVDRVRQSNLASYITKSDTWCPKPGTMSSNNLETLINAIHGRQLLIRWGLSCLEDNQQ